MKEILNRFNIEGNIIKVERFGNGHINDTFLVCCDNNRKYIFQKINNYVFTNIKGLMKNKALVTKYLIDNNIQTLHIVYTKEGKPYYKDDKTNSYYRVDEFIDNSISYEKVNSLNMFKKVGKAFGNFANCLADFDSSSLIDVIPNFHNSKVRYEHFLNTLKEDVCYRANECQNEIQFVNDRKDKLSIVVDLIESGNIPLRVTHNDTKLNNILFDLDSDEPLCIVDLDTIMQGSILYDFGDSIRFGCNLIDEDGTDFSSNIFSLPLFEAFAKGYINEIKHSINEYELKYLAFSAILITLECGMRFLDDYLSGDKYFKIKYDKQNLNRAKNQFQLVKEMEANIDKMNEIVYRIYNNN